MHMADALVSPAVAGTMAIAAGAAAAYSVYKVKKEDDPKKLPLMGVMGAFTFAAQMINFTIPGTGSSGHICGGMMLSALLGPYAGFLTMIGVLLIQCLIFSDGGLLALGCNIWNMAFYGCFIGALLIWKPIMARGCSKKKIFFASITGCIITLQLGAFSVSLETLASGISELPFSLFIAVMQPIHLAIGLVEGLITGAVLSFIFEAQPELLWSAGSDENEISEAHGRLSYLKTLAVLGVVTILTGGVLSIFASSYPDGLERSMEKVAGTSELSAVGSVYDAASKIQESTSILPDYAFSESESALGTSVSGIAGALAVLLLCAAVCYVLRLFLKKKKA